MEQNPTKLEELLDTIENTVDGNNRISMEMILESLGKRSFGPVVLLAGLITLAPIIGDIPGMPTIMGILVVLTAVQLLLQREHLWLPQWLLNRSIDRDKLCKGLDWVRPVARFLDRFTRPRLMEFTRDTGLYVIAVVCIGVALLMPPMEFIPFSANSAGLVLTIFGLALTARDGLLAVIALSLTFLSLGIAAYHLL